jgi:nitrogen fixation NifU-like protein
MSLYQEIILDHYKNPRNFGELSTATNGAESLNPLCGDKIRMQLVVEKGKIKDIKFSGVGCAVSTASASMLTEHLKGKKVNQARETTTKEIEELLGIELGPVRIKCALLPLEVLKKALA